MAKLVLRLHLGPILRKEKVVRVSDGTIRMNDGGFLYGAHCLFSNHSVIIWYRMSVSDVQINKGGSLCGKIWREEADRRKAKF